MKSKIFIFSAVLCVCGAINANASDCAYGDCDIEPLNLTRISEPESLGKPKPLSLDFEYNENFSTRTQSEPIQFVKMPLITTDNRKPLWDGSHKKQKITGYDKTVDWRDGVPIWDDSISNYKEKDFSDWFYYAADEADYEARNEIEEILIPARPLTALWSETNAMLKSLKYREQDLSKIVVATFEQKDECPFETEMECGIWRKKPMVYENVSPRSPKIKPAVLNAFIMTVRDNPGIAASATASEPFLNRYKMLMRSAQACCTDGLTHKLKEAGASDGLVYKFLSDDANFYNFGSRCLMTSDAEFDKKYPNTATAAVAADVRNGCLCRGRQWFNAMLAPFQDVYDAAPEFKDALFRYTYVDGLQREVTVSVNTDVQVVLKQLSMCP